MPRSRTDTAPLELPPGVRLAWEHRGELLPVRLTAGVPCTAAGEIPRRPVVSRKADPGPGLFDHVRLPAPGPDPRPPAAVILVLAAREHRDNAYAVANRLGRLGYAAEVREDQSDG